jgi:GxxExxY protein
MRKLRRKDLVYPELSYQIIGILFEVYNEIGPGHQERYYQKAIAAGLKESGISFKEQVYTPLTFKNQKIGHYFLDFLIEDKVVLEIKKGTRFSKNNIEQIMAYLKTNNLKLGIIANFGSQQLKFKRIINFDS